MSQVFVTQNVFTKLKLFLYHFGFHNYLVPQTSTCDIKSKVSTDYSKKKPTDAKQYASHISTMNLLMLTNDTPTNTLWSAMKHLVPDTSANWQTEFLKLEI
jgi:hypothetical protein